MQRTNEWCASLSSCVVAMGLVVLAFAAVWVLLSVAMYILNARMAPARVEHIATCLNADGGSLEGTGEWAHGGSRHITRKTGDYKSQSFGWACGPLTNASAGSAFLRSTKRFPTKHVTSLFGLSSALAGRGSARYGILR